MVARKTGPEEECDCVRSDVPGWKSWVVFRQSVGVEGDRGNVVEELQRLPPSLSFSGLGRPRRGKWFASALQALGLGGVL